MSLPSVSPEVELLQAMVLLGNTAREILQQRQVSLLSPAPRGAPANTWPPQRAPEAVVARAPDAIRAAARPRPPMTRDPSVSAASQAFDANGPYLETIAAEMRRYWSERPRLHLFSRYSERLDVSTPQGRWELLALAVLRGAPVRRERVEQTFLELRRQGLLVLDAVAGAETEWLVAAQGVMERFYLGPVDRGQVLRRLHACALHLRDTWHGDLNHLWEAAGRKPARAAAALRDGFPGIDRLAPWVVSEMGRQGVWDLDGAAAEVMFIDRDVRRVLENLGFVTEGSAETDMQDAVRHYFQGDVTVPASHGRGLCARYTLAVCLKECPVCSYCYVWRDSKMPGERRLG